MKFNKLTPDLMVDDVGKTIDYYLDVLGFEYVMGVPLGDQQVVTVYDSEEVLDFGMVKRDGVELMFQRSGSLAEDVPALGGVDVGGSICNYVELEDVGEYYAKIMDKVDLVCELETKFYGMREFTIRDCNGYFFTFAEQS